jgi:uncharacterized protein (TIGR02270 family)
VEPQSPASGSFKGQPLAIRWDIVEEHLAEAAFLHQQWERALDDAEYTIHEVAEGPEARMLAHLDALVLHGRRAAEKFLLPALVGDEPGLVFPAAFALLASEDGDYTAQVVDALDNGEPEPAAEVVRALQIVPDFDLERRRVRLASVEPQVRAGVLDLLTFRRIDPQGRLDPFLTSQERMLRCAGLRAARVFPNRVDPRQVEHLMQSSEVEERNLAIEVGLVFGLVPAWAACEEAVRQRQPAGWDRPALFYALSGERDLAPLLAGLAEERHAGTALFALGFSGRVDAADAVLDFLDDEKLGKLAGEAFSAITGLVITKRFARSRKRWHPDDPEEEEGQRGSEDDLPLPNPDAVRAWWSSARKKVDPALRYLAGSPWSLREVILALATGSTRRSRDLAFDLAVQTRGTHQLQVQGLASRQLAEVAALSFATPSSGKSPYQKAPRFQPSWPGPREVPGRSARQEI